MRMKTAWIRRSCSRLERHRRRSILKCEKGVEDDNDDDDRLKAARAPTHIDDLNGDNAADEPNH